MSVIEQTLGTAKLISLDTFLIGMERVPKSKKNVREKKLMEWIVQHQDILMNHHFCRITLEKIQTETGKTKMKPYTSKYFSNTKKEREDLWSIYRCQLTSIREKNHSEIWRGKRRDGKELMKIVIWKEKPNKIVKIVYYIGGSNAYSLAQKLSNIL